MKIKKLTMLTLLLISIFFFPLVGYTANEDFLWNATLHAKGQEIGGMSVYQVSIGIGINDQAVPAPPPAPMYSVKMELVANIGGERLSKAIIPENIQKSYSWTLSIDPHGNIRPTAIRTAIISWNSQDFDQNICMLRQGFNDIGGKIIVENMNTTSSFTVEGGPGEQFFTIECSY